MSVKEQLRLLMKSAVRIVCRASILAHVEPIAKDLDILDLVFLQHLVVLLAKLCTHTRAIF